jgi:hypothetical protein
MHKKILSSIIFASLLFSINVFAQDEYENETLPSTQYTPSYQGNVNTQEVGQNYLQGNSNFVQTINKNDLQTYCPYQFTKTLKQGDRGNDVKILQAILNSDARTIVTTQGPGSPNNETTLYGTATKDAVKRFQALFITPELGSYAIPIANGVLGPKTRIFINAICNDERFVSGNSSGQSIISTPVSSYTQSQNVNYTQNRGAVTATTNTQTQTAPNAQCTNAIPFTVNLQANTKTVKCDTESGVCESFKVFINTTQPVTSIGGKALAVTNGTVGDLRRLAPTQFLAIIVPSEKVKKVEVQVPGYDAELGTGIKSVCGAVNETASNEVPVFTSLETKTSTTTITTGNSDTASATAMLAQLNAQLDAAIKNIGNTSATTSAESQRLQQEKLELQKQIDELKKQQQNNQNCQQGQFGTVCQSPQQQQAAQQAQQNQDLMKALQGLSQGQNKPGQGQGGQQGNGGGNSGGDGQQTGPAQTPEKAMADTKKEAAKVDGKIADLESKVSAGTATAEEKKQLEALKDQKAGLTQDRVAIERSCEKKHVGNPQEIEKCKNSTDEQGAPKSGEVLEDGKNNNCDSYKLDSGSCKTSTKDDIAQYVEGGRKFVVIFNIEKEENVLIAPKKGQCSLAEFQKIASKITCYKNNLKCEGAEHKMEGAVFTMKTQVKSTDKEPGQTSCPNSNSQTKSTPVDRIGADAIKSYVPGTSVTPGGGTYKQPSVKSLECSIFGIRC